MANPNPNFINVPLAFVADASSGPNTTKTTSVGPVTLPAAVNDQAQVQLRIITADANGADEWIGVDNIHVHGNLPPVIDLKTGATLNYVENDPLTPIAPTGTVIDGDSGDFNTGALIPSHVLMIEESPYNGGFTSFTPGLPNAPTRL